MPPAPKAKRGRAPGFTMSNEHRTKIGNSQILKCLIEHTEGKREMTATQVTAGLGLLKKCLPDLTAVTLSGSGDNGELVVQILRLSDAHPTA